MDGTPGPGGARQFGDTRSQRGRRARKEYVRGNLGQSSGSRYQPSSPFTHHGQGAFV
jgi:hypothetical protein